MMSREYNKWTINEILRLEREYDLLELDVHTIARLHQRSANSIAFKLYNENFISNIKEARGFVLSNKFNCGLQSCDDSCSEYTPSDSESETESDSDSEPEFDVVSDLDTVSELDMVTLSCSPCGSNENIVEEINIVPIVFNVEGIFARLYKYFTS